MFRFLFLFAFLVLFFVSGPGLAQNSTAPKSDSSEVLDYVPEMPMFPGGDADLSRYIQKNIRYPRDEYYKGIHGRVIVRFVVDTAGKLKNAHILKGIPDGTALDQEALRLVNAMPPWLPGKRDGKKVAVSYMLPISFSLEEKIKTLSTSSPEYAGGEEAKKAFLIEHLRYPRAAKWNKTEGTVLLKLLISKEGQLMSAKPMTRIGNGLEDEALRLVKAMPDWIPGRDDDHPVEKELLFRIEFKLTPP
jgi:TonB family protein